MTSTGAPATGAAGTGSALWPIDVRPTVSPMPDAEREAILADPGFGRFHTDHMVRATWTVEAGWQDARLVPYGPLMMDPASSVLHYGQAIFEGLKAYRHQDGSIRTFRPLSNAERFAGSARRLAMAEVPPELFLASIEALVRQDAAWVPFGRERSLYLRPFMVGTEVGLGVRPSSTYEYLLIASPAGAYFAKGIHPVSVWICEDYVRAAPGGTGEAKCAGNYAASLMAQAEAIQHGCEQVVWVDAIERTWIEEMGGMNLYFVHGSGDSTRLVTPELSGTLLPGITRSSLVQVAEDLGYLVDQSRISIQEFREGCASGEITEVFACGTAAVITPVGEVKSRASGHWSISGGATGPVTQQLRSALLDIQTGAAPDRHNWLHPIC